MPRSKRQLGFSYVWVLLAVAVLGVGLGRAAVWASQVDQREKESALLKIGAEFREAIRRYHEVALVDGSHQYPSSLEDLLTDRRDGSLRRHLRKIYIDPLTGKADWGLVRVGGRIVGVHSMSKRPAIKQDKFSDLDRGFAKKKTLDQWVFSHPPQ